MSYHSLSYEDTVTQAAAEAAAAAAVVAATQHHHQHHHHAQQYQFESRNIFVDQDEKSIIFTIPYTEPYRERYRNLIIQYGGIVTDNPTPTTIYLNNDENAGPHTVRLNYIDDCVNRNRLLPLDGYVNGVPITVGGASVAMQPTTATGSKRHNRFTPEKDEFILKRVRLNPRFRHSHKFFNELAQEDILRGHTGNSIRARFRKHLEPRLEFVYKLDANDKLIKDKITGQYIKLGIDELPDTLKQKYTAEDDYMLCREAKDYILEKGIQVDLENDLVVLPYTFYSRTYRKNPKHSLHSWRDRFRRYVTPGMIPQYIAYYEECIQKGEEPKPLLKLSQYEGTVISRPATKAKPIPKRTNKEPQPSSSGVHVSGSVASSQIDESALNIDDELISKHAGFDRIEVPKLQETFVDEEEDSQSTTQLNEQSSHLTESQFPLQLKYVDHTTGLNDLLFRESFQYIKSGNVSIKVHEAIANVQDVVEIFNKLKPIGFTETLISHIVYATCADISLIPDVCERFTQGVKAVISGTEENTSMYQLLEIDDMPGVWTASQDEKLYTEREVELLDHHTTDHLLFRKKFLNDIRRQEFGFDSPS
ncbi:RAP1 [[Candida] subhashii]|uniref:DNA-binding protein RAP1 n=1 Tax=[Candida] subhashii TaxID=561895 RepID=A0A8J5QKI8_9ASCO|nr:RAP1 [[Candida] subhashii]KAG7666411.1 RAP1 [[Candida] subhashii]